LAKKVSLEKIAEETRIGLDNLRSIEQEEIDRLPDEVFVKGFLRSFAKAVDADGNEAVRRYQDKMLLVRRIKTFDQEPYAAGYHLGWRLLAVLGLLALLVMGTLWVVDHFNSAPGKAGSGDTHDTRRLADGEQTGSSNQASEGSSARSMDAATTLTLRVLATDDVRVKIIADHGEVVQNDLTAGDQIELQASASFNLLIGNAAGVKVTLNGKPIKIPGKRGEAVNILLP
jgi:cytoskeletal protein RodZ